MNKTALMLCVTATAFSLLGGAQKKPIVYDNSPAAVAERRASIEKTIREEFGGVIIKPGTLKGKILIVNTQKRIPTETFKGLVDIHHDQLSVTIELTDGEPLNLGMANERLKSLKATAAIFVVESNDIPTTFLTAPDGLWSFVNVTALAADNPKPSVLNERTAKTVARALGYTCGAGGSQYFGSLLSAMPTLDHIDLYTSKQLPMDAIMRMQPYLKGIGVTPAVESYYIDACKEGWAPAPTNEWQKAIWDKVKNDKKDAADPTNRWKRDFEKK